MQFYAIASHKCFLLFFLSHNTTLHRTLKFLNSFYCSSFFFGKRKKKLFFSSYTLSESKKKQQLFFLIKIVNDVFWNEEMISLHLIMLVFSAEANYYLKFYVMGLFSFKNIFNSGLTEDYRIFIKQIMS